MVNGPRRGEIWWGEMELAGRRPFLILTRNEAIPVLHTVVAAPITRTIRQIPSEFALGPADGLPVKCVANFDSVGTIPKSGLVGLIGALDPIRMREACVALRAAVDC